MKNDVLCGLTNRNAEQVERSERHNAKPVPRFALFIQVRIKHCNKLQSLNCQTHTHTHTLGQN